MGRNYSENRQNIIKKGEVYFIKVGNFHKIGATKNLCARFSTIQVANPTKCELVHKIKTNDMYLTERLFKAMFARLNMKGEWFTLSDADITYIKSGNYSKVIQDSIGNIKQWTRIPSLAI